MKLRKSMTALLAAAVLAGCGTSSEGETPSPEVKETAAAESSAEAVPSAEAEEQTPAQYAGFHRGETVYDDNGILITLKDISEESGKVRVSLDVKNDTDGTVRVNVTEGFFNNCPAEKSGKTGEDIDAGQEGTVKAAFSQMYFQFYMDDEPDVIDLDLSVWNLADNQMLDQRTVTLYSDSYSGETDPAASMEPLGETGGSLPVKFYKAGEADLPIYFCGLPSAVPAHSLARLSAPGVINPNCAGWESGGHWYVIYFREDSEEVHRYTADTVVFNEGEEEGVSFFCGSYPGRGNFITVGIPAGMNAADVTSLSFTLRVDERESVEVNWPF